MFRKLMLCLSIATFTTVVARAEERLTAGERVLRDTADPDTAKKPLPVTLDFSAPADSDWLAKINANPTIPADSSPAAKALNAPIATGTPSYGSAHNMPYDGAAGSNNCNTCNSGQDRGGIRGLIGSTGPVRNWLRNFEPNVYHQGVWSIEFGSQYWRSPIWFESQFDTRMVPLNTRIGYMLTDPPFGEKLKGCFEIMAESTVIPIVGGAGTIIVGGQGILRYHRVRNHRIVPYVHVGFGGVYTDSAGQANSPTTSNFNFQTQVASGSHLFLNKNWAIFSESSYTMFHHFGLGQGPGYHILGGLAGITRYFGGSDCR